MTEPKILITYIVSLLSDNSSKAEVMITAVNTYLEMSIKKSATFSQIDNFLPTSFFRAKII